MREIASGLPDQWVAFAGNRVKLPIPQGREEYEFCEPGLKNLDFAECLF